MNRSQLRSACVAIGITLTLTVIASAATIGYLKFEGEYPERQSTPSFMALGDSEPTFRELVESIETAAQRARPLDGLMLRVIELTLSTTQIEELGAALDHLRAAGTKVHMFTEIYGPAELLLASHADEAIIQKGGAVTFPGLYVEEMYLADALGALGVKPDYVQVGDYKGASEPMSNSGPSDEWNQNIGQLLDSMYANMRSHVAAGRGLDDEQLDRAMESCVLADANTAIEAGLITSVIDRLEIDEHLEAIYGESIRWDARVGPAGSGGQDFAKLGFFEAFSQLMGMLEDSAQGTKRDTIAVVHIDGPIVDGDSSAGGLLGGASVGSQTIRKVLSEIEDDQNVKGVIVRINSPGGSAIASESIWLGLDHLGKSRPVWTSVGNMAASGGYYIAVASDRIFANPSSIVGSIGVVGGKLALAGLYEKLHINVVPRTRGPRASIMGGLIPWSEAERGLIRQKMTETYDLFVSRVRAGRDGIDISKTAEGRLFTGDKGVDMGMVDDLGGIDAAIEVMASELGLVDGEFDVIDYPPPPTFDEFLENVLPMMAQAPTSAPLALEALRELLGPIAFDQLMDHMGAMLQLRTEPVLLTSPRVIIRR